MANRIQTSDVVIHMAIDDEQIHTMNHEHDPIDDSADDTSTTRRWIVRGLIALVAAVALIYGGILFYANVLNDAPDALDEDDLAAALAEPTDAPVVDAPVVEEPVVDESVVEESVVEEPVVEEPVASDVPADGATDTTTVVDVPAEEAASFDGTWVPTSASEFGYRVDEVLGGVNVTAVGRSNEIEGSLTVDDTTAEIDVVIQVANITSDDSRRDGQFRGRIMDVDNFPTATFRTTQPIDFGAVPVPGEQVTATATGELTLKGVTLPVIVDVVALADTDGIGVLGEIPITFTDFGIDNPSNPGVSLEDEGVVEFVLVFERS